VLRAAQTRLFHSLSLAKLAQNRLLPEQRSVEHTLLATRIFIGTVAVAVCTSLLRFQRLPVREGQG